MAPFWHYVNTIVVPSLAQRFAGPVWAQWLHWAPAPISSLPLYFNRAAFIWLGHRQQRPAERPGQLNFPVRAKGIGRAVSRFQGEFL
jgi:hypothetical protein